MKLTVLGSSDFSEKVKRSKIVKFVQGISENSTEIATEFATEFTTEFAIGNSIDSIPSKPFILYIFSFNQHQ